MRNDQRGMTLIEIIFVIALLGTLMTILLQNLGGTTKKAKEDEARLAMGGTINTSLQTYKIHNNRYPTTEQGLNALITDPGNAKSWSGPYLSDNQVKDPWDNEFTYESDGRSFKLRSGGDDGELNTDDDITFPEEKKDQ